MHQGTLTRTQTSKLLHGIIVGATGYTQGFVHLCCNAACRKERFEQVTKEVHKLPMEEFVTREELRRCTLHELRVSLISILMSATPVWCLSPCVVQDRYAYDNERSWICIK